ncbi:AAA family ATPase [Shimia sp.]|uniref:AAA family ATPase n=1 Tax=Shimia sp. TaxID=1954381 RepID=UPI0032974E4E
MRLNCLDLTRYGKFTELSLPFGTKESGKPDLHVIYGANEAGKSTLLSGWLDLLFQIPVRSSMGFLHPYSSMKLGAALEIDGRIHDVIRIKKRGHSLLDAHGSPIGEALLHGGLRGLDRSSYAAMFSLNRQTLDEGGESILASEGDLGELLFQASAGLSDLTTQLSTLREESMEFLNATGRKGRLKELRAEFDELGVRIKGLDTAAPEFARMAKERDAAQAIWQNARKTAEAAQAKLLETERLSGALPLAIRLKRFDGNIADLGDTPVPPKGWLEELAALDRAETEMATLLETTAKTVNELQVDLGRIPQDNGILEASDAIASTENLKSAYDTALVDLPKRVKERDAEDHAIRDSLARLDQAGVDPATVLPQVTVLGRLRGLVEQHSGVATKLASAAEELERARVDAEQTAQRLNKAGGSAADLGALVGLVQNTRRDDPVGSLDRSLEMLADVEADWQERLIALAPWSGDGTAAESLVRPSRSTLERLAADLENAAKETQRERETLERLEEDVVQRESRLAEADATATITLEDAAKVRARRETEWGHHRAKLNNETADRFEEAMRLDDQVAATITDQRTRAEMAQESERALIEAKRLVDAAKTRVKEAETRHDELATTLAGIVTGMSTLLPSDMNIALFLAWLTKLDQAHEALRNRSEAHRKVSGCKRSVDRARSGLLLALSQAGRDLPETTDLTLVLETAQSLLDRKTKIEALSEADVIAQQELTRRAKSMDEAKASMAEWQSEWKAACAETWMAKTLPNVSVMRAVLAELDQLRRHHDRATELDHRIAAMQTDSDQFKNAVNRLSERLGITKEGPAHEMWHDIKQRLRLAEVSQSQRADLEKRLENATLAQADLNRKARIHRTRTEEFASFFQVDTWQQAREALTRAGDRTLLVKSRNECAADLCAQMHAGKTEEALERLKGTDEIELEARAESLRTDLKTLRSDQEEAHTGFRNAEDALENIGGDEAVARLEEQRQTLLLEMEDGARQNLQRRLGLLAVDAALRQYRDTHRSGMLERASEAFRAMSRGRYSGLAAQPDGAREVLVALAAEGGSKEADQLSDGTRAQLYLALRIAGYHEFVRNNGPVPFVADDIMESFDDDRAAEAFGLLAKMSETGQVIYLTHHTHVCDIAQKICPSVRIHELPI